MSRIPRSIAGVDVFFLEEVLGRAGVLSGSLSGCEHERLHEQSGVATVFRTTLRLARGSRGPHTVIVKLPPSQSEHRSAVQRAGFGATEVGFYRDLAASVPVRTPECYLADHDPEDGGAVLVLEDLGDVASTWHETPLNTQHARAMLACLARLHARFWNSRELDRHAWLGVPLDRVPFYRDALESVARLLPVCVADEVPAPVTRLLAALIPRLGGVARYLSGPPHTLVHGDFTHRNCALVDREPVAFDWQLAQRARGARDVAYLIPFLSLGDSGVTPDSLIGEYHARLCSLGVSGYTREDLRADQDLATLDVMQVGFISMLVPLHRAQVRGVRVPRAGVLNLLPLIAAGVEHLKLIERLSDLPYD